MKKSNDYDNTESLSKTETAITSLLPDGRLAEHTVDTLIESRLFTDKNLAKNVLFACELCNGPLVPSSTCVICKKASSRTCLKCNLRKLTDTHLLCCYVFLKNQRKFNQAMETAF